jgi:AraC-like DNA-binding protein
MDNLSIILNRLSVSAGVFFSGGMCGLSLLGEHASEGGHMHLLASGKIDLTDENGDVLKIDKPSLIFFPKPTVHSLQAREADNAQIVCASLRYGSSSSNALTNALPKMIILAFEDDKYLEASVKSLFDEAFHQREGKQLLIDRLTDIIVIYLIRNVLANRSDCRGLLAGLAHEKLATVITNIHEAPEKPWTLKMMSEQALMSRSKFIEEFKRVVGHPPGEYLTNWRISVAQTELKKGRSVSMVANIVGYENSSALSKAFKRRTSLSPSAWLKKYHMN